MKITDGQGREDGSCARCSVWRWATASLFGMTPLRVMPLCFSIAVFPILADVVEVKKGSGSTTGYCAPGKVGPEGLGEIS